MVHQNFQDAAQDAANASSVDDMLRCIGNLVIIAGGEGINVKMGLVHDHGNPQSAPDVKFVLRSDDQKIKIRKPAGEIVKSFVDGRIAANGQYVDIGRYVPFSDIACKSEESSYWGVYILPDKNRKNFGRNLFVSKSYEVAKSYYLGFSGYTPLPEFLEIVDDI